MKKDSALAMPQGRRVMKMPEVLRLTGLGRTSLFLKMKQGRFPRSVPTGAGPRARGWDSHEIQRYIDAVLDQRKFVAKGEEGGDE